MSFIPPNEPRMNFEAAKERAQDAEARSKRFYKPSAQEGDSEPTNGRSGLLGRLRTLLGRRRD